MIEPRTRPLREWVARHPLWSIWIVALLLRTAYVLASPQDPYQMIDSPDYDTIARELLAGHGYVAYYYTGFLRPPLYPLLVAAAYVTGGLLTLQIVQIVLGATTAVLVGVVARLLHRRAAAAWVAALIAAVYPWSFAFVGGVASENLFVLVWVGAAALMLRAADRKRSDLAVLAGVVFGLACLTRANLLTAGPALMAWLWWRTRAPVKPALFAVALGLTLLPFTAYNWFAGNGLVVGSSGGGMSFFVGNNLGHTKLYKGVYQEDEWLRSRNVGPEAEAYIDCPGLECMYAMPLRERDAFFYAAGLRYIREAPLDVLITDVKKFFHYWRPWVDPRVYSPAIVLVTGLSFGTVLALALASLWRMPRDATLFVLAVAISASLTVMIWHVQLRYRFALLDPILIAAASGAVSYWLTEATGGHIARVRMYFARPRSARPAVAGPRPR